ncbi:MAG: hypothetical protein ACOYU3_01065 [Bacillota bacterium]
MAFICYSLLAYAYLYHSLVELYGMTWTDAAYLTYMINTANIDSCQANAPNRIIRESDPFAFVFAIRSNGRAYRTEIQFYKAIQALLRSIDYNCLTPCQKKAVRYLKGIARGIDFHFYSDYGVDIDSNETVYPLCRFHLIPHEREPTTPFRTIHRRLNDVRESAIT